MIRVHFAFSMKSLSIFEKKKKFEIELYMISLICTNFINHFVHIKIWRENYLKISNFQRIFLIIYFNNYSVCIT